MRRARRSKRPRDVPYWKSRERRLCKYSGFADRFPHRVQPGSRPRRQKVEGDWPTRQAEKGFDSNKIQLFTYLFILTFGALSFQRMSWLMLGSRLSRFANIWVTFLNAANRCWGSAVEGASFQSLQSVSLLLANGRTHKPAAAFPGSHLWIESRLPAGRCLNETAFRSESVESSSASRSEREGLWPPQPPMFMWCSSSPEARRCGRVLVIWHSQRRN